jgi:hypothetical protein
MAARRACLVRARPQLLRNPRRAQIDSTSTVALGWIRVYIDGSVVPALSVQVDDLQLRSMFTDAAYVGFSSATGDNTQLATVTITNWCAAGPLRVTRSAGCVAEPSPPGSGASLSCRPRLCTPPRSPSPPTCVQPSAARPA